MGSQDSEWGPDFRVPRVGDGSFGITGPSTVYCLCLNSPGVSSCQVLGSEPPSGRDWTSLYLGPDLG